MSISDYIIFILGSIGAFALGSFFLIYGIKGGLIEKRMLANGWRKEYDVGHAAVRRGLFYILLSIAYYFGVFIMFKDVLSHF